MAEDEKAVPKAQDVQHIEGAQPDYKDKDAISAHSGASSLIDKIAGEGRVTHNPLVDLSREQVIESAKNYAERHGLSEYRDDFIKGALLARNATDMDTLTEEEKQVIIDESEHPYRQPKMLYYLSIMCAMCAIVQGMDETVINGAQLYYVSEFGLDDSFGPNVEWIKGLVVGAPYLCCAVFGCWLTQPLSNYFGRRGAIFVSCLFAAAASIWEAFTYNWKQLFGARLLLGIGIGPKSAITPIFSAECSPAPIRGALVMMWQMWTAFGIMFGYVMSLVFMPKVAHVDKSTSWRLVLGSTVVAPLVVCAQVYFTPESPRWYIKKGRHDKALQSLLRLRRNSVVACRDLFFMATMIEVTERINDTRKRGLSKIGRLLIFTDLVTIPRVRRGFYASQLLMFGQQFCGINIIAYFSSSIFSDAGFSDSSALLASWGYGMINWLFALPAVFTIDHFGRRSLVLFTYPFLALFLIITGAAFYIPDQNQRIGVVAFGIYVYTAFYSPGMGPVPFTYSAEAYPLHIRDLGMSVATATLWGFNFLLSLTWPPLLARIGASGGFFYYAGWNVFLFVTSFMLVPETKELTLEELDMTYSVPTSKFIAYQTKHIPYNIRKTWFRQKLPPPEPLYEYEKPGYGGHTNLAGAATNVDV